MDGWGWQKVHDPETLPQVMAQWKASLANADPFEMSFPLRSGSGEFRRFLTRVMPIRNARGEVVLWFGTNTDIEAQHQAIAQRDAALLSAQEASAAKDEFLAMLGHELRNPLAPIVTALDLLRRRGAAAGRGDALLTRRSGPASRRTRAARRPPDRPPAAPSALNAGLGKVRAVAGGGVDYTTEPIQMEEGL